ncbi:hypothetical protein [Mesorhizobium sp.]|uniref:hypothetical protein n=1 Tax=Mesorhizobium sp. TaxID=1871066 RepID=UPI0025E1A793|nr:hypothetical protein [Mesorhizobium sp.]
MDSHKEIPGLAPGRTERPRRARRVNAATMRAVSPLPPPEEVFIDWLMSVPHDADLETAAQRKIAVIDRCGTLHPDVLRLRTLLAVVAGTSAWPKRVSNL